MIFNILFGIITIIYFLANKSIIGIFLGALWVIAPTIMCYISKDIEEKKPKSMLNIDEIAYAKEIGRRTFSFFWDNLTESNNYLVPDNYQENRKNFYVDRTSSTNIGLSLLSVQAGIDLNYIEKDVRYTNIKKYNKNNSQFRKMEWSFI